MVLPLTYGCSAAKISPEFALVSLLAGYWHSWSSSVFVNWTIWPGHYREEKCDVMLPWLQKFWTSRIFLDRDGHLHCPTMEEKYGLSFCPWVQCTGNSYVSIFSSFFFCHSLLRSTENFDTMVTWRIFVSSLLTKLRPFFKDRLLFLQSKWDSCKAVTPSLLTPRDIAAGIMCFSSEKRVLAV